nr:MAG TPA: hypothetical protein [Caudoviricetes sp.]
MKILHFWYILCTIFFIKFFHKIKFLLYNKILMLSHEIRVFFNHIT